MLGTSSSVIRLHFFNKIISLIKKFSSLSYDEEKLPQSPCFKLVTNCEQVLTAYCARRLLVFRKMREPNASLVYI